MLVFTLGSCTLQGSFVILPGGTILHTSTQALPLLCSIADSQICKSDQGLTRLSSSRLGHASTRLRAPFTGGPGSVAGLPAPRLLLPDLELRLSLPFLPLGASTSFYRAGTHALLRKHSLPVTAVGARGMPDCLSIQKGVENL